MAYNPGDMVPIRGEVVSETVDEETGIISLVIRLHVNDTSRSIHFVQAHSGEDIVGKQQHTVFTLHPAADVPL